MVADVVEVLHKSLPGQSPGFDALVYLTPIEQGK